MSQILLAEDSAPDVALFKRVMPLEWKLTVVGDGAEAWNLITVRDWACIILDDALPRVTGFEIAERLRYEPHGPLVIWSGYMEDIARDRAKRLGIAFVSKHEPLDKLVQTVRALIR